MNFFAAGQERIDAEVERRLREEEEQCMNPSPFIVNFFKSNYGMDQEQVNLLWDIAKVCGRAHFMKNTDHFVQNFVQNNRVDFVVWIADFVRIYYEDGSEYSKMDGSPCSKNLTDVQRTSLVELFDESNKCTDEIVKTLFNFLCDTSFPEFSIDQRDMFWILVSSSFTSKEEVEEFNALSRNMIRNQILSEREQ